MGNLTTPISSQRIGELQALIQLIADPAAARVQLAELREATAANERSITEMDDAARALAEARATHESAVTAFDAAREGHVRDMNQDATASASDRTAAAEELRIAQEARAAAEGLKAEAETVRQRLMETFARVGGSAAG